MRGRAPVGVHTSECAHACACVSVQMCAHTWGGCAHVGVSLCLLVLDVCVSPPPPGVTPLAGGAARVRLPGHTRVARPPGGHQGANTSSPLPCCRLVPPPRPQRFLGQKAVETGQNVGRFGAWCLPRAAAPVPSVPRAPGVCAPGGTFPGVPVPGAPHARGAPAVPCPPPAAAVSPGRWGQARPRPGLILPTGPGPAVPEVLPPCPGDVGRGGDPGCHSSCPPPAVPSVPAGG